MIKLVGDYHTHTVFSHGKGSIRENVQAARRKGLKEIAITDHGLKHFAFAVKEKNIKKMRDEIDSINEEYDDIRVLLGLECNIISKDGRIDINESIIKELDILLLGYHMMVKLKSLKDYLSIYGRNYSHRFFSSKESTIIEDNTKTMIMAINRYDIDFITHPGARILMDINVLAKEAVKLNTALEINAASNIMTVEDIKKAAQTGVKFIINSDAHTIEDVGNFRDAIDIAEKAGLSNKEIINTALFKKR